MKKTKKIISVLLALAMAFIMPVSATAVDLDTYADGFWNQDEQYCLRLGNFGLVVLTNYVSTQAPSDDTWVIYVRCRVGDSVVFHCSINSSLNVSVVPSSVDYEDWDFSDNAPLGARIYINDSSLDDTGMVIFFDKDSDYLADLANCNEIFIQREVKNADSSINLTVGEPDVWYSFPVNFDGLDEYKTSDNKTDETAEEQPVTEETVEEIISEETPVIDEITEETPIVEEITEETPVVDESTEEAPAVSENPEESTTSKETEEEIPVADETEEETPVAEETKEVPVVDTDVAVDMDKGGSPDTGADGIAVTAAAAVVALGVLVLSRRKN